MSVLNEDSNVEMDAAIMRAGIVKKYYGRVGDSPIVGLGVYADNETCTVSAPDLARISCARFWRKPSPI